MPKPPVAATERFRLQVELTNERVQAIDKLVNITGMASRKEFLDNALSLMAWAIREKQKGRLIASVEEADPKGYREVTMPCLEHLGTANVPQETRS
ncbi:MAG: hypothetical protein JWO08_1695 [Verrucomicrobiaceae bacterium]|nr:hypothetical protein [Verrucomicrobiaceae bacterium]